ncbi:MAG TPA: hypothetical protein VEG65_02300 [Candidatus Bathyarchaeia archaeon]|nr:hypothetical protein [Candidatus Bathyarchaeia archaeon]
MYYTRYSCPLQRALDEKAVIKTKGSGRMNALCPDAGDLRMGMRRMLRHVQLGRSYAQCTLSHFGHRRERAIGGESQGQS